MKIKKVLTGVLSTAFILAALTACTTDKASTNEEKPPKEENTAIKDQATEDKDLVIEDQATDEKKAVSNDQVSKEPEKEKGKADKPQTTGEKTVEFEDKAQAPDNAGIVAGKLTATIENPNDRKSGTKFRIHNNKEKNVTLTLNSSNYFDYNLKDKAGKIVYTYTADKSFTMAIAYETIKPGEYLEMELDLETNLKDIPKGDYTLEVWSTAEEAKEARTSIDFHWVGESLQPMKNKGKLKVKEEIVTFVGLIDGNSIEVKNNQGKSEVYRLADVVKTEISAIKTGVKLTLFYVEKDGKKEVQSTIQNN